MPAFMSCDRAHFELRPFCVLGDRREATDRGALVHRDASLRSKPTARTSSRRMELQPSGYLRRSAGPVVLAARRADAYDRIPTRQAIGETGDAGGVITSA